MMRVFVIPDIHLKPWMLNLAENVMTKSEYDKIVMLGDFVDEWDMGQNLKLYEETLTSVVAFCDKYPNTLICYGNHDLSYKWEAMESGYSDYARETVLKGLKHLESVIPKENIAYIHRIDNVLFSHAGLTEAFVRRHFGSSGKMDIDQMIGCINQFGKEEMWENDSPIWARPQYDGMRLYPGDMFQVVGHTPVKMAFLEGGLLSLDTFSKYRDGRNIGDGLFAWIDTETQKSFICPKQ